LQEKYPTITIIKRSENGDQLACSLDGFRESRGQYIVFLDADDFLLEQCIASHVLVHLSLEQPVGFTCSNMIQLANDRLMLASTSGMSWYVRSEHAVRPSFRLVSQAIAGDWVAKGVDQNIADDIYEVDRKFRLWPWSATSAFLFRKDALGLFAEAPGFADLRRTPDGVFARGINALTGSVLIDRPLAAWRAHGKNYFYHYAELRNLRNTDIKNDEVKHRRWLLNEVLRDPGKFRFAWPAMLKEVLETFDTTHPNPDAPSWTKGSYLSGLIVQHEETLLKYLEPEAISDWKGSRGIPADDSLIKSKRRRSLW
jgi:glycosyltransferase involved in cell wall biosynthesis